MYICRTRGSCLRTILTGILVLMIIFNIIFITDDWTRSKSNHEIVSRSSFDKVIVRKRVRNIARSRDKNIEELQGEKDEHKHDQNNDLEKKQQFVKSK